MDLYEKRSLNRIAKKFKNLEQPIEYKLIPLTRGAFAKVDNEDFDKLKVINWYITHYGYAKNDNHSYIHRLILNCPDDKYVDHINHDKLDNRKSNLRICTRRENNINRKPLSILTKTSLYKGVCWDKSRNKWRANVGYNGKKIHLGRFENELESAKAYDDKAKELFGEYAYLNFM